MEKAKQRFPQNPATGFAGLPCGCPFLFSLFSTSVNIFAIADLDHVNHQHRILDGVKDAVTSLADTITLEAR